MGSCEEEEEQGEGGGEDHLGPHPPADCPPAPTVNQGVRCE